MNKNNRIIITIVLVCILLFLLSWGGTIRNRNESRTKEISQEEVQETHAPAQAKVFMESAEEGVPLTVENRAFLDGLINRFLEGDLEGAARLLEANPDAFITYPCMYLDGELKQEVTTGNGLVFLKPSIVYYGEFKDGVPDGSCTAISVLSLEEGKRYDYSYGSWKNGTMNGEGECGYRYYDGVTEDITVATSKKGQFKEDFMQGEITYSSTNAQGETADWQFQTADGVIVPDDRWVKEQDEKGEVRYKLLANGEEDHAYVLSESAIGEERWKNLIVFSQKERGGYN